MDSQIESYYVNKKLYVSTKFLSAYFNRSEKQIGRWKKDGMPKADKIKEINKRSDFFFLDEVIQWVSVNINREKARNSKSESDSDFSDIEDETEEERVEREQNIYEVYSKGTVKEKMELMISLPRDTLDNMIKMENIVTKSAKNREYDSEYVLREKVKKGQQELARMFLSFLKTSLPVLSKELENKEQNDIYHSMDRHFKKEIDKLRRYINKVDEKIITFDEIVQAVICLVSEKNIAQITILEKLAEIE